MKLSHVSVIFIIIILPIMLVLSYYISLHIDTINMQTAYTEKQLSATKEAVSAFEINTVEWNEVYSGTSDSKRRDIRASVDTFVTSFANSIGVGGASKETILTYIPAVTFTMYDGFYIYAPSTTKEIIKDENGVAVFIKEKLCKVAPSPISGYTYDEDDEGKILYKCDSGNADGTYKGEPFTLDPAKAITTEFQHILKPYISYIEQLKNNYIVNYTLDNYITIYGNIEGQYTSRSGYLNVISNSQATSESENGIYIANSDFNNKTLDNIYFSGQQMKPERLSEVIVFNTGIDMVTEEFNYVYEAENDTKVYYDGSRFFRLDSDLKKVYVEELTEPLYKKCTIPVKDASGKNSYIKAYRSLADGEWYIKDDSTGKYVMIDEHDGGAGWQYRLYSEPQFTNKLNDYSAINYCVETYVFTNMINGLNLKYSDGTAFEINKYNDPENEDSDFTRHKKNVIRDLIMLNLGQAITSYSENTEGEYQLPILSETEWDQVLSNISVISFVQNIPIGLKYYNNYAIATSTFNKEYVNPNQIYIYDQNTGSDLTYHSPYCEKLSDSSKLIGYRSIDSIYREYETGSGDTKETKYYFRHRNNIGQNIDQSCYYCLVQRDLYKVGTSVTNHKKAYYTALARERYLQLESITITGSRIEVTKTVSPNMAVDYGQEVEYTITIKNNGAVNDYIYITDTYQTSQINKTTGFTYASNIPGSTAIGELQDSSKYSVVATGTQTKHSWNGINIASGEVLTIKFKANLYGSIGELIKNKVIIYSGFSKSEEEVICETSASTMIVKNVTTGSFTESDDYNIVLVLDHSVSMVQGTKLKDLYNGVNTFVKQQNIKDIFAKGNSQISVIEFWADSRVTIQKTKNLANISNRYKRDDPENVLGELSQWIDDYTNTHWGTFYNGALEKAKTELQGMDNTDNKNVIIFFTDGIPTADIIVANFIRIWYFRRWKISCRRYIWNS